MEYQTDYILRLIEQMGSLMRRATRGHFQDDPGEAYRFAGEALGLALSLDTDTIERLSPASFVALLEMNNFDDRVIALVSEALGMQVQSLEGVGRFTDASARKAQAEAVRGLLDPNRAN